VEKPREIAVRVLSRHADSGIWLEDLLADELEKASLSTVDRALAQELVLGTTRQLALLDWIIARRTDGREQPSILRALLRTGLYQLFLLDRIPDYAAVNETVDLSRKLGFAAHAGFLNALLRGCLREREALEKEIAALQATQVDIGYSHPRWLCERWAKRYGDDGLRTLLLWNNKTPPVYARVNTLKTTPTAWLERLAREGVEWAPVNCDWAPGGWLVQLVQCPPLSTLASFREGWFYIQDPSTLLAVRELGAASGDSILDLCAAPGGKTTALAQVMKNEGRITAFDPDPHRRLLIRENCERLGVANVRVPEGRPSRPGELFDRILIDAPCSNTGVMRRRAELRWRLTAAEIARLRTVQLGLVRQAAAWLKPHGILVYSTCSLEPEENEGVSQEFVRSQPGWRLVRERQLSPLADGVDGAYVAVLTHEELYIAGSNAKTSPQ
jgi:16S rRNA (cytosine967-C5)-methyltransferase